MFIVYFLIGAFIWMIGLAIYSSVAAVGFPLLAGSLGLVVLLIVSYFVDFYLGMNGFYWRR